MGGVADLRYMPLPDISHHVKIGSTATKSVFINRRELPKIGKRWDPAPLRWGIADS